MENEPLLLVDKDDYDNWLQAPITRALLRHCNADCSFTEETITALTRSLKDHPEYDRKIVGLVDALLAVEQLRADILLGDFVQFKEQRDES